LGQSPSHTQTQAELWASMAATVGGLSSLELYRIGLAIRQYSLLVAGCLVETIAQPLSTNSIRHSDGSMSFLYIVFDLLLYGNLLFRLASVNQLLVGEVLPYPVKYIEQGSEERQHYVLNRDGCALATCAAFGAAMAAFSALWAL